MKQYNNEKSFTLMELLIAVSIFVLVVTAASGIFVSSLRAQRHALSTRTILDETSFLMEYMSRALRMAKKEMLAPACLSSNGLNYEETRGGNGIKFINHENICQEFFLDTVASRLKEIKGGKENFLTSSNLQILAFNIRLEGQFQDDDLQPKVSLFLDVKGIKGIKIQTTVSQRNLDVQK